MRDVVRSIGRKAVRRLLELSRRGDFHLAWVILSILLIGWVVDPLAPISGPGWGNRRSLFLIEDDMELAMLFASASIGLGIGLHFQSTLVVCSQLDKPYPSHAKIIPFLLTFPPAIAVQWVFGDPLYASFWFGVLPGGVGGIVAGAFFHPVEEDTNIGSEL